MPETLNGCKKKIAKLEAELDKLRMELRILTSARKDMDTNLSRARRLNAHYQALVEQLRAELASVKQPKLKASAPRRTSLSTYVEPEEDINDVISDWDTAL